MTLMVISILIISGPAKAITLGITDISDETPDEQADVSFLAKVDIHTNDVVPLTNITINIKKADDSIQATFTFNLEGTELSDASNTFTVQKLSGDVTYNNPLAGYGYGYASTGYLNQSFGYGYQSVLGYGYNAFNNSIKAGSGATSAEFVYNITWTTPDVGSNTVFNIEMQASADDGSSSAIFQTKTPTEITVQADTPTTPSGGGGGTSTTTAILFTKAGVDVALRNNYIARFAFGGAYHTIKVTKIGTDYINLEVASDPVTVTLNLLESKKLDLDDDNYYDLYVKLNEIKNSKAYLTVKSIHEIITPVVTPPAEEETPEEETPEETPEEETPEETPEEETPVVETPSSTNLTWLWILIVLILIGLIAYLFVYKKKKGY